MPFQIACTVKPCGPPLRPAQPAAPAAAQPPETSWRKRIRVSQAMSTLKIQNAVNENLPALYGKFSLGFDKKEKTKQKRLVFQTHRSTHE